MQKFENMDVIAALEAIMHQNTAYYQSDFAYDIKMLRAGRHPGCAGSAAGSPIHTSCLEQFR